MEEKPDYGWPVWRIFSNRYLGFIAILFLAAACNLSESRQDGSERIRRWLHWKEHMAPHLKQKRRAA